MNKQSKIKVVLSNCLFKGNSFINEGDQLEQIIREKFANIPEMNFKGVTSNIVRGNHNSFTLGIDGVVSGNFILELPGFIRSAMSEIIGFHYTEARVEHDRIWDKEPEAVKIIRERYGIDLSKKIKSI